MKKILATIVVALAGFGIFWWVKPQPPFGVAENIAIGSNEEVLPGEESLFAEVNAKGEVLRVIVADKDFINSGKVGDPKKWVRTYYNGRIRGKYAGVGHKYNKSQDIFTQ